LYLSKTHFKYYVSVVELQQIGSFSQFSASACPLVVKIIVSSSLFKPPSSFQSI